MVPKKAYLIELRRNREQGLADLLEEGGYSAADFEKKFGRDALKQLKQDYTGDFLRIQNRTRGKLGELWGEVLLTSQLNADETEIKKDSVVFHTPHGDRRIDVFWPSTRIAVEAKSGFVSCSRSIRNQIEKDKYLLEEGTLVKVVWILLQGASKRARQSLEMAGIVVVDGYEGELPADVVALINRLPNKTLNPTGNKPATQIT